MKTELAPLIGVITAATYAGAQISDARSMLIWLLVGALTGACTAVCLPVGIESDKEPHAIKKKFVFSLLCGVGLTFCSFAYHSHWVPTADRVFALSWLTATLAWVCVPVAMPIIRAAMRKWGAK